jgi:hypothetical protein
MGPREEARPRIGVAIAVAGVLALSATGCGEKDFANRPRPPAPIEIGASVNTKRVQVSPDRIGAGVATFTVANLSHDTVNLTLVGPTSGDSRATGEIPAGGVGNLKTDLREGDYEVTAGSGSEVRPATLRVGPERKSSANEVLQP